jgi:hypothetical protein
MCLTEIHVDPAQALVRLWRQTFVQLQSVQKQTVRLRVPSSINGIVGIKPTVGLLSRSGIIPISHTQDTAGPMARTVKDAAIMLGALTEKMPQIQSQFNQRERAILIIHHFWMQMVEWKTYRCRKNQC